VPGPAHDGGEDGSGGIVSGEPGLTETGSVITDQSGAILLITHDCRGRCGRAITYDGESHCGGGESQS